MLKYSHIRSFFKYFWVDFENPSVYFQNIFDNYTHTPMKNPKTPYYGELVIFTYSCYLDDVEVCFKIFFSSL